MWNINPIYSISQGKSYVLPARHFYLVRYWRILHRRVITSYIKEYHFLGEETYGKVHANASPSSICLEEVAANEKQRRFTKSSILLICDILSCNVIIHIHFHT